MRKTVKKSLMTTVFLAGSLLLASEASAASTCSLAIDANKHTGSNWSYAGGDCEGFMQGIYVPEMKQFNITGIYTDNVVYSGQQFSFRIPTIDGSTVLTVNTIQPAAAPAPEPEPALAPAPKQASQMEAKPAPAPKTETKKVAAPSPSSVESKESKELSTRTVAGEKVGKAEKEEEESKEEEKTEETESSEKKTSKSSSSEKTEANGEELRVVKTAADVSPKSTKKENDFSGITFLCLAFIVIGGLGFGGYKKYRKRMQ